VFVPDPRGYLRAFDATQGRELWTHNNGQGHNGGIITYTAKGKQYVAVMTGWGGLAGDDYAEFFKGTFAQMPKDSGIIKVFALP
jgi:glucose dehydrogenase